VLVVSGGDVVKGRSTRLSWNFFDKDLPIAIAGLLRSQWSLDVFVWFALVHAPWVFSPSSWACGSPFASPV
jgi:hypothetical protein